ncbi:MAG TPA: phospholipase D-like domain-containing protein [Polyangia bacterium]|nr:phospholipase D-like domain-containing protein [Polyangia bacterium]
MDFVEPRRAVAVRFVGGRGHYEHVVQAVMEARRSVWISTANLKELMVEDHRAAPGRRRTMKAGRASRSYRSVLAVFAELASRGVELRILHASPPSGPFQRELARHPGLARGLALRACPRVHFKAVVVDGAFLYLGSANWTGAGLGAKGTGRRNFELGFSTDDDGLLDRVQELYTRVWSGAECRGCKLREICPAPLDGTRPAAVAAVPGRPKTVSGMERRSDPRTARLRRSEG